jgi:hypothetical protein
MDENTNTQTDQGSWGQDGDTGPQMEDLSGNPEAASEEQARPRGAAGREMLVQLQQMIDTLATQAGPVMREVAAKAAELAAVAGTKAGPIAHKAAGVTEMVGQKVAAKSKDFAAELRRPAEPTSESPDAGMDAAAEERARTDDPKSSDWSAPD